MVKKIPVLIIVVMMFMTFLNAQDNGRAGYVEGTITYLNGVYYTGYVSLYFRQSPNSSLVFCKSEYAYNGDYAFTFDPWEFNSTDYPIVVARVDTNINGVSYIGSASVSAPNTRSIYGFDFSIRLSSTGDPENPGGGSGGNN